jgi:hypothetical protein
MTLRYKFNWASSSSLKSLIIILLYFLEIGSKCSSVLSKKFSAGVVWGSALIVEDYDLLFHIWYIFTFLLGIPNNIFIFYSVLNRDDGLLPARLWVFTITLSCFRNIGESGGIECYDCFRTRVFLNFEAAVIDYFTLFNLDFRLSWCSS